MIIYAFELRQFVLLVKRIGGGPKVFRDALRQLPAITQLFPNAIQPGARWMRRVLGTVVDVRNDRLRLNWPFNDRWIMDHQVHSDESKDDDDEADDAE